VARLLVGGSRVEGRNRLRRLKGAEWLRLRRKRGRKETLPSGAGEPESHPRVEEREGKVDNEKNLHAGMIMRFVRGPQKQQPNPTTKKLRGFLSRSTQLISV